MSRVQLALNVTDIDAAVDFYSKLFGAEVNKRKPGYANFAIAEPPLKLVLIENPGAAGTLNHLGVEVGTVADVTASTDRLDAEGLATATEDGVCCYAEQSKVWVHDPDGAPWEVYTVIADTDDKGVDSSVAGAACGCEPEPAAVAVGAATTSGGGCCG